MKNHKIGHAFSDHVFEEKIKPKRGFSPSKPRNLYRFIPMLILFAFFIVLTLRLFTLQIVRASYYSQLSDANRIRTVLIPAPRGIIFDRNGNALVRNVPAFSTLKDGKVVWLTQDDALKRVTKGESVIATVKREYIYKDIFAHVLGYVGQVNSKEVLQPEFRDYGLSDFTGRMGLEEEYEKYLHGVNGKQLYEVDAKGARVRLLGQEEAIEGAVLNTTLDLDIQKAAAKAMEKIKKGAVVVSDPRSGAILALYSKPSFDPNLFTFPDDYFKNQDNENSYQPSGDYKSKEDVLLDGTSFPLLDRVISGVYPPGSTYKIVTALAALSTGKINKDTEFEDTGVLSVGGSKFGTWNYLESGRMEGNFDVVRALVRSNDIFFYQAALKTGVEGLHDWSGAMGLGTKTGINLPGEVDGTVPDPSWKKKEVDDQWYLGDTINMSIGQGFLETTPLQINRITQVVANGGTLFKPFIVKGTGQVIRQNFISKDYLATVKEGLKGACQPGGTGFPMFNFKVKNPALKIDDLDYTHPASAGADMVQVSTGCKTGTAEANGENADPHAWFTIFAPYYNPEVVVTVLVENGGQGSSVAAPIARDILTEYFEKKK